MQKKLPDRERLSRKTATDSFRRFPLCVIYDRLGQKEEAKKYNDLAGTFHPFSPYYLQNKVYFEKGHGVGAKQTA